MFRRTPPAPAEPAPPEVIAIDLDELTRLEKALLEADRLRHVSYSERAPLYFSPALERLTISDIIAEMYQRAGAASVVQPDPARARVPVYRREFVYLADAIETMKRQWARRPDLDDAQRLYNRFNALLGQARAIVHMGGTVVFAREPEPAPEPEIRVIPSTTV